MNSLVAERLALIPVAIFLMSRVIEARGLPMKPQCLNLLRWSAWREGIWNPHRVADWRILLKKSLRVTGSLIQCHRIRDKVPGHDG